MSEPFVNKVAESGIITLNLEDHYPANDIVTFDMKDHLFMGLILKEKDFREAMKNLDLSPFTDKYVAVTCSADAVIPMWAYMLVASYLQPVAKEIVFGNADLVQKTLLLKNIEKINPEDYRDQRVVIKGCGELPVSESAYMAITSLLRPVVKSIMYGEPCSTVPIYKKPRTV
jgi:Protein of unknown function (DUF2480)